MKKVLNKEIWVEAARKTGLREEVIEYCVEQYTNLDLWGKTKEEIKSMDDYYFPDECFIEIMEAQHD